MLCVVSWIAVLLRFCNHNAIKCHPALDPQKTRWREPAGFCFYRELGLEFIPRLHPQPFQVCG
jgi:hypothetical protein